MSTIGTILLAGLGDEYKPMIMAIESSGQKITSDFVKAKLLQNVTDEKSSNSRTSNVLYTKQHGSSGAKYSGKHGSTGGSKKFNSSKKVKCFECNKMGHMVNQCSTRTKKNESSSLFCFTAKHAVNNDWFIDSGASAHMTNRTDWVIGERQASTKDVLVANNCRLPVKCVGEVSLSLDRGKSTAMSAEVKNVLVVPELCTNLLSVSQLVNSGNSIEFNTNGCQIYRNDGVLIGTADLIDNMYKLRQTKCGNSFLASKSEQDLWHRRFGHVGHDKLHSLNGGNMETGIAFSRMQRKQCEICLKGKQARLPFGKSDSQTTKPLELIHSDVCGPMYEASFGGALYFATFMDDFTGITFTYTMERKAKVFEKFIEFKAMAEKQTGEKILKVRTDNGTEYVNTAFKNFFRENGIIHQTTVPYTPAQNGKAERMNRTLVEKARCMMFDAKLSPKFWAEAINTATYLVNRLPIAQSK